jgi:hypothetical protein
MTPATQRTEEALMKIAAKAWHGIGMMFHSDPDKADITDRFREIQRLADEELAAIQKRRETA